MNPEEVLKKHVEGKHEVENSQILAASSLVAASRTKELAEASLALAETTKISATLLAETTKASAELLAKTTLASAQQLSESNAVSTRLLADTTRISAEQLAETTKKSERRMKWLTIAVIATGVAHILIAVFVLPTH